MTKVKIRPIILAGGSGTRLWPMSRESLPKQFCRIERQHSLFQQTIDRLNRIDRFDAPVIMTNERHVETVRAQLAELEISTMLLSVWDSLVCASTRTISWRPERICAMAA